MNIPLDHVTPVEVRKPPTQSRASPTDCASRASSTSAAKSGAIARPDISVFGRGEDGEM